MAMNPVNIPIKPSRPVFYGIWATISLLMAIFGHLFTVVKWCPSEYLSLAVSIIGGYGLGILLISALSRNYYNLREENTDRAAVNNPNTPYDVLARIYERRKDIEEYRFHILSHPNWTTAPSVS